MMMMMVIMMMWRGVAVGDFVTAVASCFPFIPFHYYYYFCALMMFVDNLLYGKITKAKT